MHLLKRGFMYWRLSEPTISIRRDYPHWDTEIFNRYQQVIDSMSKYKNLLGFRW